MGKTLNSLLYVLPLAIIGRASLLRVDHAKQTAREGCTDERTENRNPCISPIRPAFPRDRQESMCQAGPKVSRGIDGIARGCAKGEADRPYQASYEVRSESCGG